ncbi:MAG: pyruvate ferredoxin oxidoreductase, partial [Clostridiales bacterium]|nr:pyruvate ferredoxin oxidoreductase [Clostridiales bacterium]
GIQRSSATPKYANTTTSPSGKVLPGKMQYRKDLAGVLAAHEIPYVAQSAITQNMKDLYEKAEKAIYTPGPAFLNVLAPCPRGWRYDTPKLLEISKLAVDTCVWPLYEVVNGEWRLSYKPKEKLPVEEWLKPQGRFKHLFEKHNAHLIEDLQREVDTRWEKLLKLCGEA